MICFEDRELEEMVLSGNSCIAVPIEIYVPLDAEIQIITYSCFGKVAEEFQRIFKESPLSEKAIEWLDQKIYSDVKMFGYEHSFEPIHMMSEFVISKLSQLQKVNTCDVEFVSSESDLAEYDISLIEDISVDRDAAVVIKDNKLVSIACVNDVSFDDDSVELFVETDSEYRNIGYGSAVVSAIAEKYLKKGLTVRYKCARSNEASVKLANKCGFVKCAERFSYVCFAVEEN